MKSDLTSSVEDYKVTVFCLVYNHENYIRDALEGFVMQKTDFSFQVIVHDDASLDSSAMIIEEYANKYPHIFKPIFQKKNQYKTGRVILDYILPNLKGQYVAICEGDDYWTTSNKLQKQFDYMESHSDCTFCFTNAIIENQTTFSRRDFIPYSVEDAKYDSQKNYDLNDFYKLSFIPTASFFMRREAFEKSFELYTAPCPAGDLKYRLYVTSCGYAHFLNEKTCVYREEVPNSATTNWNRASKKVTYIREKQIFKMIEELDVITEKKYHTGLMEFLKIHADCIYFEKNIGVLFHRNSTERELFSGLKFEKKVKAFVKLVIPRKIWEIYWSE